MSWLPVFLIIIILIALNALYVAAEFSAVSTRKARLSQAAEDGNTMARTLFAIIDDPQKLDAYVATCQLGITVTSLVLGFYGQASLSDMIAPYFIEFGEMSDVAALSVSATVVLLSLTILQVLLGELVPKNIGIQYPERLAIATLIPLRWSMIIFRPLIWFFNGSGQLIMRMMGQEIIGEHAHIHSPDEIVMLVEESSKGGLLQQEERRLLKNTLQLREMKVREVMIPRTQMFTAPANLASDTLYKLLSDSAYSRLPLYNGNIDNIIGVVHLKDLLCLGQQEQQNVNKITHPIPFVPEAMSVKAVFSLLQRRHLQIAIVLDEFGGTAGMVTLEDLIEEIFGELQDEFDTFIPNLRVITGNRVWIRGNILITDLNEWLDIDLADEDVDTVGGLVLNEMGHVPVIGEQIVIDGNHFKVEKMRGRGISAVSMACTDGQIKRIQEGDSS